MASTLRKKTMKKDREKEIYELWWCFLKESNEYKEFCDSFHEKKKIDIQIYEKYKKMFSLWGDVHRSNFESWWALNGKTIINKYVTELSESIGKDIDKAANSIRFNRWMNKQKYIEPTIVEFRDHFIETIKSKRACIYLKINIPFGESKTSLRKKISSEISAILTRHFDIHRDIHPLDRYQYLSHCWPTAAECDRLRNNLKLYVMAKEKGFIDGSGRFGYRKRKEMIQNNGEFPESRGVQYTRQINEVRDVIKWVELGFFPWMERRGKNKGPRKKSD